MNKAPSALRAGRPSVKTNRESSSKSVFDAAPAKRLNVEVSTKNHAKLKIYAAQQGKTIKDIFNEFIEQLPLTPL